MRLGTDANKVGELPRAESPEMEIYLERNPTQQHNCIGILQCSLVHAEVSLSVGPVPVSASATIRQPEALGLEKIS